MKSGCPHCRISRRRFLQVAAAAGAIGLTGGAAGYGLELAQWEAPFPEATGRVAPATGALPGPGTPLLLAINTRAADSFGAYLGEILRAEGLNAFRTAHLERLDRATLAQFAAVILSAGPLNPDEVALLEEYVTAGGTLIAIRPDSRLADLCGVTFLGGQTSDGYLMIANHPASRGIADQSLQFHGDADHLRLAGAEPVAWLATAAGATDMPLVTLNRAGQGQVVAWAFDLARSIALTRQGNPAWADQDRDNIEGVRAVDMFAGWIDLERIGIPQADEQQRLLVKLIDATTTASGPLPRLWYLPGIVNTALIATGDAHGSNIRHIEDVLSRVERYGGQMSIYYAPPSVDALRRVMRKARRWAGDLPVVGGAFEREAPLPAPGHIAAWRARGHEFGMHPYVEAGLEAGYNAYWNDFLKLDYGPLPPTVRTHRILWHGWVENARVQARYGIRMNLDHYHVGETVRKADGAWTAGYLTGSGLPMRFVDERGDLLSVYQQHTHLVDEHLMNVFDTGQDEGLTGDEAVAATTPLIQASLERYPAALGLQCHIDPFTLGGDKAANVGRWLEGALEYAAAYDVPILSAERWLTFTEARAATAIDAMDWNAERGRLTFQAAVPPGAADAILLMLPGRHGDQELTGIELDGKPVRPRFHTVSDVSYVALELRSGVQTITANYRTN